jgi:AraC-like DNA-binding protein
MVLVNADEVHSGGPATPEGWRMRTLHVTPTALAAALEETRGPALEGPVVVDRVAARTLYGVHWCSEKGDAPLKRQTGFVALAARLFRYHAERASRFVAAEREPAAMARARAFLGARLAERVTLDEVAAASGLPPFRLLRAFSRATGMPPHAWLTQLRVREAMRLLRRGEAPAEVAAATGFADQPHLTRVFKRIVGVTPGRFRAG